MIFLEATTAAIGYVALAVFFGQLVCAGFLLPHGEPALLRRSLIDWATASLFLFLVVSVAALILQGSRLQRGFPSAELLRRYLMLTQSGHVWLARQVYGALVALLMALLARGNSGITSLRVASFLALPLLVSRSLASHAVTVGENRALAVTSDSLHLIATALWGGGLVGLWQSLRFAKAQPGEALSIATGAVDRFSRLALASVPVLLVTGVYQSWIYVGNFPTLATTDYGKMLLVKVALVSLMLSVGAFNSFSTKPLLARARNAGSHAATQKAVRRIALESALGVAVFSATGLLTFLPPGIHAVHQTSIAAANAGVQPLQPAEGARVRILLPKPGEIFVGDSVPLKFNLARGKRGHHVHAYVDGQLMGMFESAQGTLNGIAPGRHTLELRVVAADHRTELPAQDRVEFIVK